MALSKTFPAEHILSAADVNEHLVNHVPNEGDQYDTGWIELPLINGWQTSFGPVEVRRIGFVVYFQGEIWGGSDNTAPWAPLPVEMCPARRTSTWLARAGTSTDELGRLTIQSNGVTNFRGDPGASPGFTLTPLQYLTA